MTPAALRRRDDLDGLHHRAYRLALQVHELGGVPPHLRRAGNPGSRSEVRRLRARIAHLQGVVRALGATPVDNIREPGFPA